MTVKKLAKSVIDALPADVSLDDIIHALYVRAKFSHGESEIRSGKGMSHEQAAQRLKR